jgi:predicted nucleic acid-binding protein
VGLPELDQAIGAARRVLIDSSTLLAFYTVHEGVHPLAKHVLGRIEQDGDPLEGWCSTVTLIELLVRPTMAGSQVANSMLTSLTQFPYLHLIPVDVAVATQAAAVRAREKISPADALIVATGLVASCDVIISNDDTWQRRLAGHYPQVRFLYLDAFR